jgi:hypothetical protein
MVILWKAIGARPHVWNFVRFVLTSADGLCCVWFIYPILCWCWCPEIGTSSTDCAQLSRLLSEDEDTSPVSETLFLNQNRTMDKVQKVNNCINIPPSQTG